MSAVTPTFPLPLELEDGGLALSHQGAILGRLYDASSFPCCEDVEKYDNEQRALAAFIVRACNSHDALTEQNAKLREALEELKREAESLLDTHPGVSQWSIRSAIQTAEVELKAAQVKP